MTAIDRPDVKYDDPTHTYTENDRELLGVSTVAKIGGAEETWGIASVWGFRIGYEGAHDVLIPAYFHETYADPMTKDDLRAEMQRQGLTPWSKRDRAADRGTWVHDFLESLGQSGIVYNLSIVPEEEHGHAKGVLQWFLDYRPVFYALEVQVASRTHGFAGRFDVECWIDAAKILPLFLGHDSDQAKTVACLAEFPNVGARCMVDLKTSKGVYPTTHFPQLAGYEGARREMGFPPTDAQFVLNTHPDGTYDFAPSWAVYEDFLAYLGALRAIRRIRDSDPEEKRKVALTETLLAQLPGRSREIVERNVPELAGLDSAAIGKMLGKMRKGGRVTQDGGVWSRC